MITCTDAVFVSTAPIGFSSRKKNLREDAEAISDSEVIDKLQLILFSIREEQKKLTDFYTKEIHSRDSKIQSLEIELRTTKMKNLELEEQIFDLKFQRGTDGLQKTSNNDIFKYQRVEKLAVLNHQDGKKLSSMSTNFDELNDSKKICKSQGDEFLEEPNFEQNLGLQSNGPFRKQSISALQSEGKTLSESKDMGDSKSEQQQSFIDLIKGSKRHIKYCKVNSDANIKSAEGELQSNRPLQEIPCLNHQRTLLQHEKRLYKILCPYQVHHNYKKIDFPKKNIHPIYPRQSKQVQGLEQIFNKAKNSPQKPSVDWSHELNHERKKGKRQLENQIKIEQIQPI